MTAGNGDTLDRDVRRKASRFAERMATENFRVSSRLPGELAGSATESGVLSWTAVTRPLPPTVNGAAFYLVQGTMLSDEEDD